MNKLIEFYQYKSIVTFFNRMKNWIKDTFYYNPRHGIPNLFKWFKTIYNNRDWDHYFIYEILIKKLEFQEKNIRKNGIHEDAEKDADNILYAINLLKKIMTFRYGCDEIDAHDKKWGKMGFDFILDDELTKEKGSELYRLEHKYKNTLTEEQLEQEKLEYRAIIENVTIEEQEDIKKLFAFIGEHIEEWWD